MKLIIGSKLYIAGPMTGRIEYNVPAFMELANYLRRMGYVVRNPAEINPDPSEEYGTMMRRCFVALMDCHAIVMLPGWETSRGAMAEFVAATAANIPCFDPWFNQIKSKVTISLQGILV